MLCIKVFLFASCFLTPLELSTPTCFPVLHKGLSLFCAFPPFLSFWHQLASFDLTLIQVFEWLLCLGFFECLKALLMHQHVSLLISNGGIGLIYIETIVSVTYLGNWALVEHVIVFRLLLNSHPFLLEAIGASNSGSFPFHVYLRSFHEFFPLVASTYLPPF